LKADKGIVTGEFRGNIRCFGEEKDEFNGGNPKEGLNARGVKGGML
jgi:hypothetical protein